MRRAYDRGNYIWHTQSLSGLPEYCVCTAYMQFESGSRHDNRKMSTQTIPVHIYLKDELN